MRKYSSYLLSFCCIGLLIILLLYTDQISSKLTTILEPLKSTIPKKTDDYIKQEDFLFVQNTNDFIPFSKKDLKNIFYTMVNQGWSDFTFYCPKEYVSCIDDMKEFSQDQDLLTHINNFVHPFHSFSDIKTTLSENGEINIDINYLYQKNDISIINQKIEELLSNTITNEMTSYEKIKALHDTIVNQTKYDVHRNESGESNYKSYIAYGPLLEGYATCNGYTDAMAILLEHLNIPNYKIATTPKDGNKESEGHVWNAVYLDDKWLHLDLTWDDPVSNDGKDYLQHKYFLVDNEALKKADSGEVIITEHLFEPSIYREFQNRTS